MAETRTPSTSVLLIFLTVTNLAAALAAAPAPAADAAAAPPPGGSCSTTLMNLSPCLNFIMGTDKQPAKNCCTAFKSVVNNDVVCLCELFTSNNPLGQPIDQKRALAMASSCKVTTPPLSECSAIGIPVAAPVTAPGSASPPPKGVPPTNSSGTNSTATPGTSSSPNEGSVGAIYNYVGYLFHYM
eukprot:PITA_11448